ncbi:MAG: cytochrome c biogenesis protein CcsA [Methanosarcinales archaeon]
MLSDYIAARETARSIGAPIMTYIFIVSLIIAALSVFYLTKRDEKFGKYLNKLIYIDTLLFVLGFLVLIWFHLKIYQTVVIEYPEFLRNYLPVTQDRFAVPLWIENEKMYFWTMCISLFTSFVSFKYGCSRERPILPFLGVMLALFGIIIFFFTNPFDHPLPIVDREISSWYAALASGHPDIIAQTSMQMYGRITYYYNSTYMWTHPPMLFIAYASLAVTFAACVLMLFNGSRELDKMAYSYAKVGYIFLTVGMLIGYPWAVEAWKDQPWWWDPKINGAIMMWLLYSAYLHTHIYIRKGRMWRTTALIGIGCFVSLIFTYLLTYLMPGIHSVVQP